MTSIKWNLIWKIFQVLYCNLSMDFDVHGFPVCVCVCNTHCVHICVCVVCECTCVWVVGVRSPPTTDKRANFVKVLSKPEWLWCMSCCGWLWGAEGCRFDRMTIYCERVKGEFMKRLENGRQDFEFDMEWIMNFAITSHIFQSICQIFQYSLCEIVSGFDSSGRKRLNGIDVMKFLIEVFHFLFDLIHPRTHSHLAKTFETIAHCLSVAKGKGIDYSMT